MLSFLATTASAGLTVSPTTNVDNTCVTTKNGFQITTYPCIIEDVDGVDVTQFVDFKWTGGSNLDTSWIFGYDDTLESGRIYVQTDVTVPTKELCNFGNATYDYGNGTIDILENFSACNYNEVQRVWTDATPSIAKLGKQSLGGTTYALYSVNSQVFAPQQEIKTMWVYTPKNKDKLGEWRILGKRTSDSIANAISGDNYIYQDPWWNSTWTKSRTYTLQNNVAFARTIEPLRMTFNNLDLSQSTNCAAEVRVTNQTDKELPITLVSATYAGGLANCTFDVMVPNIPASSNATFTIYWGNPTSTTPTYTNDLSSGAGVYANNGKVQFTMAPRKGDSIIYVNNAGYKRLNWYGATDSGYLAPDCGFGLGGQYNNAWDGTSGQTTCAVSIKNANSVSVMLQRDCPYGGHIRQPWNETVTVYQYSNWIRYDIYNYGNLSVSDSGYFGTASSNQNYVGRVAPDYYLTQGYGFKPSTYANVKESDSTWNQGSAYYPIGTNLMNNSAAAYWSASLGVAMVLGTPPSNTPFWGHYASYGNSGNPTWMSLSVLPWNSSTLPQKLNMTVWVYAGWNTGGATPAWADDNVSMIKINNPIIITQDVVLYSNGANCSSNSICLSGFCTDGVCCDTSCSGTCQRCNQGAQNVLLNSEFEAGAGTSATYWNTNVRSASKPHTGTFGIGWSGTSGAAISYQNVSVTPGVLYTLGGWCWSNMTAGNNYLDLADVYGDIAVYCANDGIWHKVNGTYTPYAGNTSLTVRAVQDGNGGNTGWGYWDDVTLAPSTLTNGSCSSIPASTDPDNECPGSGGACYTSTCSGSLGCGNTCGYTQNIGMSWTRPLGAGNHTQDVMKNYTVQMCSYLSSGTYEVCLDPQSTYWADTNFNRRKNITITGLGALTDFPGMLNITYDSDMKANFDDLRFYNVGCGQAGGSLLNYDMEYSTSTYAIVWLKDTLASGVNKVCMYYSNPTASSGKAVTSTWNTNYGVVYHMTTDRVDSTSNARNAVATVGAPVADNTFGYGTYFDGVDDGWTTIDIAYLEQAWNIRSHEIIFKTGSDVTTRQIIFAEGGASNGQSLYIVNGRLNAIWLQGAATTFVNRSVAVSANTLYHVVAVYGEGSSTDNYYMMVQGSTGATGTPSIGIAAHTGDGAVAFSSATATKSHHDLTPVAINTAYFKGTIYEIHIIDSEYNSGWWNQSAQMVLNQNSFVSQGSEERYEGTKSLIPTTIAASPFWTSSSNPTTFSQNFGQCSNITWVVNATGNAGNTYDFFASADLVELPTGDNTPSIEVKIGPDPAPKSNGQVCTYWYDCTFSNCVDGVCCNSACSGTCQRCSGQGGWGITNGTCGNIAATYDPDAECGNVQCGNGAATPYYWGWSSLACYYRLDVSASTAACGGSGSCYAASYYCPTQGQDDVTGTSCQCAAAQIGCSSTTSGTCNNALCSHPGVSVHSLSNQNPIQNGVSNIGCNFTYQDLTPVVSSATCAFTKSGTTCYQESANVSTTCGGLSTGTYSRSDQWNDGDWNTVPFTQMCGEVGCTVYWNYTKPSLATSSSLLRIGSKVYGDSTIVNNITLPSSCWNQAPLRFSYQYANNYWKCWDGSTWQTVLTSSGDFAEEAMDWILLTSRQNGTGNCASSGTQCYQESANVTPTCNMYPGSYSYSGGPFTDSGWGGASNAIDGNWNTYWNDGAGQSLQYANFTVTSRTQLSQSILTVKYSTLAYTGSCVENTPVTVNGSLSQCGAPDKILRIRLMTGYPSGTNANWTCYNGTDWNQIIYYAGLSTSCGLNHYEEGYYWSEPLISCSVGMQYYDGPGTWSINASVSNGSATFYNDTTTFTYNSLSGMALGQNSVSFGTLSGGATQGATNDPILVYNQGNTQLNNVSVKAYDLKSGANTIAATIFNVSSTDAPGGKPLVNNTYLQIPSVLVSIGQGSNTGFYLYAKAPAVAPGAYSSQNDWVVFVTP